MTLRPVEPGDLPVFYEYQRDPESVALSGVAAREREAFEAHWRRILADPAVNVLTIVSGDAVAGSVLAWDDGPLTLTGYWLGREFWGRGIASQAFGEFLEAELRRPLTAYVSPGNGASVRVLERWGFQRVGQRPETYVYELGG
jgi:RimJ/RimL family protein N-acetyltransferase